MGAVDILFIVIAVIIWLALIYNLILIYFGYKYFLGINELEKGYLDGMSNFPMLTILIPCHNEAKVIGNTLLAIDNMDYPKDKLKIVVVNDNSSDNILEIFEKFKSSGNRGHFNIVTTSKERGGKGKAGALNYGIDSVEGDYIVVYDADNTPEPTALKYLVKTITTTDYAAVIGKFRTRNKHRNLLTKMINIEGISFQWLAQGGRGQLFDLCTIPGTNYIINRKYLEQVGGFDPKAISEDTEISIKLYKIGKRIKFMPLAVTWEQEPETVKVLIKQRIRWVKGNLYVLFKYFKVNPFNPNNRYFVDILSFFLVYILFLLSVLISDGIFLTNLLFGFKLNIKGNINFLWFLTFVLYLLQVSITLSFEKGELNRRTFGIIVMSYFTYSQLWLYIATKALFSFLGDNLFKKEVKWYKTERF